MGSRSLLSLLLLSLLLYSSLAQGKSQEESREEQASEQSQEENVQEGSTTTTTTTTTTADNVDDGRLQFSAEEFAFYDACVYGKMDILKATIETFPDWVHKVTSDGEHCLHLASINGQPEVTTYMIDHGADPNVRTTFSGGLRMHPLSWNVYGGYHENVRALLDGGADINLDFDDMGDNPKKMTVLDVSTRLMEGEEETPSEGDTKEMTSPYQITHKLLLERGAKHYATLAIQKKYADADVSANAERKEEL